MLKQLQSGLRADSLGALLIEKYPECFAEDDNGVPLKMSIRFRQGAYNSNADNPLALLTLMVYPLRIKTMLNFDVALSPSLGSFGEKNDGVEIQRVASSSIWPTGLLPAPIKSDIPQIKMEGEFKLSERSISYIQTQVADAIVRALGQYSKEELKRMQLFYQNRQLIVE